MHGRVIQPARLRLARLLRGLQQNELADAVEISATAISQYESGSASPGPATLERIALTLGCRPDFFTRPLRVDAVGAPFFRSRRAARKRERNRAHAYALAIAEVAALIEEHVELPAAMLARPVMPIPPRASVSDIEDAAAQVRAAWKLPAGPIPNVVRVLEARGVVVSAVGAFDRVDAFSLRTTARPVVVLCSDKGSAARRRFDAAHELAHLVLHEHAAEANDQQERQAHSFAAAFLMPADLVDPWLPRRSNQLDLLEQGSTDWGVSMQALLFRARSRGTLSEDAYRRAMRRMAASGWRTKEPVEIGPPEAPELLRLATAALPAAGSSVDRIAEQFGVSAARVVRMLRLPEEGHDGGELAMLRPKTAAV